MRHLDRALTLTVGIVFTALAGLAMLAFVLWMTMPSTARERFAGEFDKVPNNIRSWFKSVRSPRGVPCCDIADGHRTTWRHGSGPSGYEVPIEGVWTPVPPEAVVYGAGNPLDEAVVWYVRQGGYTDKHGEHPIWYIRCFVPGDGA